MIKVSFSLKSFQVHCSLSINLVEMFAFHRFFDASNIIYKQHYILIRVKIAPFAIIEHQFIIKY